MLFRAYDPLNDKQAVHRIFHEVGWLVKGNEELLDAETEGCRSFVAEINGQAECLVSTTPGRMRYLDEEVPMSEVVAVATSRVARQGGVAKKLQAHALAQAVAEGAVMARVVVFDQGYYNQVGFGPGGYEHWLHFDPSTLRIAVKSRPPRRLTQDDFELVHASRLARFRGHGATNYDLTVLSQIHMAGSDRGFGLGYCDGPNGELTHHFWCSTETGEHGPYHIDWIAYQTTEQFLELMALIKSLSDQVYLVRMREPQGIQLQDLLVRPFRYRGVTEKSRFQNEMYASADWQIRILDLPKCLAQTHLPCGETRFNLNLTDPVENLLEKDAAWRGVAGEYHIVLGLCSKAEPGNDTSLPTLTTSVNAFSRLWLGVRPATGLAATDDLSGPAFLLEELDRVLRLPEPKPDWVI